GSLLYIVQVGTTIDSVEHTLNSLLLVLLVSMPVALAVSLAGGWFMAGRALRPVDAITLAAQRIAGGDLTQRLTAPASADEIGRLTNTFNDMIDRLETSFRQIRQFSSDASHELRTPLTVMKGETELALRRPRETDDYDVSRGLGRRASLARAVPESARQCRQVLSPQWHRRYCADDL
ncbi:MAG: HAMP domain-containing protein, partial [Nitrospirae bacterium]|nr:HAMP domain-containing protein [Nitrospirota bacterium]